MRNITISVLSGSASLVLGVVLPMIIPDMDSLWQYGLLGGCVLAYLAAFILYLTRRKHAAMGAAQATHGSHSPIISGNTIHGPASIYAPPPTMPPEPAVDPVKWVPLDDAVRYIARVSTWGHDQDHADPNFSIRVLILMRDALRCGDIRARGRKFHTLHGGIKNPPLHSLEPIGQEFWEGVHIEAYWALNGTAAEVGGRRDGNAVKKGAYEGMHDVVLDARALVALWPPRLDFSVTASPPAAALMSFGDLVRHVAFKSECAASYQPGRDWRGDLKAAICRPLKAGRVTATGLQHTKRHDRTETTRYNVKDKIPADFWALAKFFPSLLLTQEPARSAEYSYGDNPDVAWLRGDDATDFYVHIEFDRQEVEQEWPPRSEEAITAAPSPIVALAKEDEDARETKLFAFWWEYWVDQREA